MSVVITVAPTGPIATKADNPDLPTYSGRDRHRGRGRPITPAQRWPTSTCATKTSGPQPIWTSLAG